MKRRTVLWMGLGTLGALAVGWSVLPPRQRLTGGADQMQIPGSFTPNAWVRIGRDDSITLFMPRAEIGQGTHTGLAMLLAEELGCTLAAIQIAPAPIASVYNNVNIAGGSPPLSESDQSVSTRLATHFTAKLVREIGFMVTGGSSSISDLWVVLREAGAMARETLREAAARHWGVRLTDCTVSAGKVRRPDGQFLTFGAILSLGEYTLKPASKFPLKSSREWTLIGTPAKRLEAIDKVTGRAVFASDIHEPGMLYAEIELCPFADGTLNKFDEAAVRGMPGVVHVLAIPAARGAPAAVAVVADQRWRAHRAVQSLNASWNPGASGTFDQSLIDKSLLRGLETDSQVQVYRDIGTADPIITVAKTVLRSDYEVPYLAHAAMEPLCCTVKYEITKATVWAGVQVPNVARNVAAKVFDLDAEQVSLAPVLIGGAFGRRLDADFVAVAAAIGRAVPDKLVQLQWRREHDMRHDFYRPAVRARLSAAIDPGTGMITAYHSHSVGQSIGAQAIPRQFDMPAPGADTSNVEGATGQAYAFAHHKVTHTTVELPVGIGFWRSVGHSQQAFFQESFMDELARLAKVDPVEFRLRHLKDRPRHAAVLKLVAERAGWGSPMGTAADGQPIARGIALHESFGSIVGLVAEVSEGEGGVPRIHRVFASIDCGVAVNPNLVAQQLESSVVFALSAALYGRISFKGGAVEQGNFDSYPILRFAESPIIQTFIVPSEAPPGGVGEPGVPPVAPAVTNALATLTGRRVRRLPLIGA
ncbi:MAG: xanthine dehydrogenase family protein molybdopterin-binding subunit [Gammaproteobacteria bacterium]|nr:xanthine dehydrogenase family protein molybdopterin-binding subunit [Gammaproteobacteria bacterium]